MRSAPPTRLQLSVRSDGSGITGFCFAIHVEPVACLFVPLKGDMSKDAFARKRIAAGAPRLSVVWWPSRAPHQ
jgi:hypothetical protein